MVPFLHHSSLCNSISMKIVRTVTKVTGVNAYDEGDQIIREHIEEIVTYFITAAERGIICNKVLPSSHKDATLADTLTNIVVCDLHKQSNISGVIDIEQIASIHCKAIASAFAGDWNYRYYDMKRFHRDLPH